MKPQNLFAILLILCLSLTGCGPEHPEPIAYGEDQCAFCRMSIADRQFGAELVTDKGRVLKYDAAECMINQLGDDPLAYRQLYAVAYDRPGSLLPVDSLLFVIDPKFRSPMGADLAAFTRSGGTPHGMPGMDWSEVVQKVNK